MRRLALALLPLLLTLTFTPPALAQRVDLTTAGRIVRVADPQIAPDGVSVAVVIGRANYADNRYDSEIVLVETGSRAQRTIASGRRAISSPRWTTDGSRLAFLAHVDGHAQVFVVPVSGGGETVQITTSPTGVVNFAWRPDGRAIAYSAFDEESKKEGEERFNRSFDVGRNSYLQAEAPRPVHLWLAALDGAPAKRLTSGAWTLPAPFPPGPAPPAPSWSPDGRSLAFVKINTVYSGERGLSTVQILDVESGSMRALSGRPRGENQPVFSPDGTRIAYWFPRIGFGPQGNDIWIAPASGGYGAGVAPKLDRHILRGMWLPDGKSLLLAANDKTTTGLWIQPIGGDAKRLDIGKLVATASYGLDASVSRSGRIALVASEPQRPAEVYVMSSATSRPERLTEFNAHIAAMQLGRTETIEWDGPDDFRLDGVVTYPPDFQPGHKYPLVLYIHGGPRATSKEAFSPRAQLMAAQGWMVFEPNYRGSDNLGTKFMAAIQGDAGAGPGRDVMSGVDHLKSRGFVDETKIAVSGWSYGGYMTTWLIGNYPGVWRAAVAGAPVTDNLHQYVLSDGNSSRAGSFGGSPFTDSKRMERMREQSPIHYVSKVKAPTLLMALTGDYRVPITQAYAFYHGLRDANVPVQFVAYPLSGHSPTDPVHQRDVDRRWIEWIRRHFDAATKPSTDH